MTAVAARLLVLIVTAGATGCNPAPMASSSAPTSSPSAATSTGPAASASSVRSLVIVGRIVTLDEPSVAEALLIEGGTVTAVGDRDEVLARAGEQALVVDIGEGVAYPGFIDAHAHWIGDRDRYGAASAEDAMEAALERGWTSIAELWVNRERLSELEHFAADAGLPLRVDAYLALNEPSFGGAHFGDWYAAREPGESTDRLRVAGVKIHLDHGARPELLWEADALHATIATANDAGWQVAVHVMRTDAHGLLLDAFEAVLGPTGPNPLRHRIDHAIQVTDSQIGRLSDMQIPVVIHLDSAAVDWLGDPNDLAILGGETTWLTRWRDFVDAGLHVAAATDAPWIFPDFVMTDDIGRPVDQIAGGMDPRGRLYPEPPAWLASQLLTAEEGLRAVTLDAAYALGDEKRRGHLSPGTLGDVTILSGDVTAATPDEIRAMTVIATVVGGIPAYCAAEFCSRLEG